MDLSCYMESGGLENVFEMSTMTSLTLVITLTLAVVMTSNPGAAGMDYHFNKQPLEAFDGSGHLGKSATLSCKLTTGRHNRGWLLLTWARIEHDGTILRIVSLPVRDKIPTWGRQVHLRLKERVTPLITIQPGHVEFNIRFANVTCDDESEYRCIALIQKREIKADAELSIFASQKPPNITEERPPYTHHHHNRHNHNHRHTLSTKVHKKGRGTSADDGTVNVTCRGDVGLPPKMLLWYVRRPGDSFFQIIDGQEGVSEEFVGCHVIRSRTLSIPTGRAPVGTQYRCGYHGSVTQPGMYGEYVIEHRHKPRVKTVPKKKKKKVGCKNGNCQVGRSSRQGNTYNVSDNVSSPPSRPVIGLLVLALLVALGIVSAS